MWLGPLQNTAFAHRVLKSIEGQEKDYGTWPRMKGMLTLVSEVSDTTHGSLHHLRHHPEGERLSGVQEIGNVH